MLEVGAMADEVGEGAPSPHTYDRAVKRGLFARSTTLSVPERGSARFFVGDISNTLMFRGVKSGRVA